MGFNSRFRSAASDRSAGDPRDGVRVIVNCPSITPDRLALPVEKLVRPLDRQVGEKTGVEVEVRGAVELLAVRAVLVDPARCR